MKQSRFAKVVLPHPPYQILDYLVPVHLVPLLKPGMEIWCPLGNRKTVGLVIEIRRDSATDPKKIKEVIDVISDYPVLLPNMIKLANWLSEYYLTPINHALRAVFPAFLQRRWEKVVALKSSHVDDRLLETLKDGEVELIKYLQANPEVETRKIKQKNASALIRSLVGKGLLVTHEKFTRPAVRTKKINFARARKPLVWTNLTPKQRAALELLQDGREVAVSRLGKFQGISPQILKSLANKGRLNIYCKEVRRDPLQDVPLLPPRSIKLNRHQAEALKIIQQAFDSKQPEVFLLHGVTGSGKTEIYIRAAKMALQDQRSVLILLPEIALTPLLIGRFLSHFPGLVAVWHSRLSEGERFDEWRRIAKGQARIVIGARSALFAPLKNLGLVVVDEEHEPSYKQTESPRYHGRDVAIMRAKIEKASVILGSATPSLESYNNSFLQKNRLLTLPQRVDEKPLPRIQLIDLRTENMGPDEIFSPELLSAIEEKLAKKEQCIIFLNRRGFIPVFICSECGEALKCPHCEVSLVHHIEGGGEGLLKCHHCFYQAPLTTTCPYCDSRKLRLIGWGTQRVEAELRNFFPRARLSRLDTDTTSRKGAYQRIFHDFESGKTDILLGTQMVAKGFDFPLVTLVGVVLADTSLRLPDFRAAERTFQLLTQVSGRTGRSERGGEVIIQTFLPEHYSLQAARRHNYGEFYAREIALRRELMLPPFCRVINIILSAASEDVVHQEASRLAGKLSGELDESTVVLGPGIPVMYRLRDRFRCQLIIKSAKMNQVKTVLRKYLFEMKNNSGISVMLDVDPTSIL